MKKILDFFYPNTCCFCGKVCCEDICDECKKQVEYIQEPVCKKCGKPITNKISEYCFDCTENEHIYEQGKSVWLHKGSVRWSIYQFKYHNRRIYAKFFAKEMYRLYAHKMKEWEIDTIVPVPLHWRRRLKRGYNQSEVLAKYLGKESKIPVESKWVIRRKYTKPQKALNHSERKENLKDVFYVKRLKKDARILIVDDIYTTGSTINEMAKYLYSKGAQKVFFLTISIGQGS